MSATNDFNFTIELPFPSRYLVKNHKGKLNIDETSKTRNTVAVFSKSLTLYYFL